MSLVIQWSQKKINNNIFSYKELSFRSNNQIHSQLPLVMITTLIADMSNGQVVNGDVNFTSDCILCFIKKLDKFIFKVLRILRKEKV